MLHRVHARHIQIWHCDIEAETKQEAEEKLRDAFKRNDWTEEERCLRCEGVTVETPGFGLEIQRERTRELGEHDRRMGEKVR